MGVKVGVRQVEVEVEVEMVDTVEGEPVERVEMVEKVEEV